MNIYLKEDSDDLNVENQRIVIGWRMDTIGNEICGGKKFDGRKTSRREYRFRLNDIEIYQIL